MPNRPGDYHLSPTLLLYAAILLADPIAALASPRWVDRESASLLVEAGAIPLERIGDAILETRDAEVWRRLIRAVRRLHRCPPCDGSGIGWTYDQDLGSTVMCRCGPCDGLGSRWLRAYLDRRSRRR